MGDRFLLSAMPWKESRPVDLRREFVLAALAPGANVSELCREHGVSRNTGYKWIKRYREGRDEGFADRSRRPKRIVSSSGEIVLQLIELRRRYPKWGPKKLRELLRLRQPASDPPSVKTIARILDRAGEPRVRAPRRRLRLVVRQHEDLTIHAPNDVWTVDFKGWWRTGGGKRYEPLTVRDAFSRFVFCLQMLGSTKAELVKAAFDRLFQAYGLPSVIRVDNGSPFGCTSAPGGLSRLSAWWTSLGIRVSFSRPACPQDNGGHERMHSDVATELEASPADSLASQQIAADRWRCEFNEVRPHEALNMSTPAAVYVRSRRTYQGITSATYPVSYTVRRVNKNGCVRYAGTVVFVSESLVGLEVGLRRTSTGRLRVRFYDLDLGTFEISNAPLHRRPRFISRQELPTPKRAAR